MEYHTIPVLKPSQIKEGDLVGFYEESDRDNEISNLIYGEVSGFESKEMIHLHLHTEPDTGQTIHYTQAVKLIPIDGDDVRKASAKAYALLQERKVLEARVNEIKKEKKELDTTMFELFQEHGINQIKYDDFGTIYLCGTVRPNVTDTIKFFEYLRDNDQGDMIKESVHAQTLKSWVTDRIDNGEFTRESLETIGISTFKQYDVRVRK